MNDINKLFKEHLIWKFEEASERYFTTEAYDKSFCCLRINDFPDEPLWTLYFKGQQVDFDDEPEIWKINYGSLLKDY